MKAMTLMLAFLLLAPTARAQGPITLNAIAPGMPMAEVEKRFPAEALSCRVHQGRTLCEFPSQEGRERPEGLATFAGERVVHWTFVLDVDRRIDAVAAFVGQDAFPRMVSHLAQQYGEAYQVERGAPGGPSPSVEWRRGDAILGVIRKPGGAMVMLTTRTRGTALANEQGFAPPSP